MLKITPKATGGRCATATVMEGKNVKRVLEPITGEAEIHEGQSDSLVPLTTSIKMVCAQPGTYSSLHVSVTTTSLYADGDLDARTAAFQSDIEWTLKAMDEQAANFNSIRHALGQSGEWKPSGR